MYQWYNRNEIIDQANQTLSELANWSNQNALQRNVSKTKAVFFRPKGRTFCISKNLKYGSEQIEITQSFTTIGVWFTDKLLWETHVDEVCLKAARFVGILYRHRDLFPKVSNYFCLNHYVCRT